MRMLPFLISMAPLFAQAPDQVRLDAKLPDVARLAAGATTHFAFGVTYRLTTQASAQVRVIALGPDGAALDALARNCGAVDRSERGGWIACEFDLTVPDLASISLRAVMEAAGGEVARAQEAAVYPISRARAELTLRAPDALIEGQASRDYAEPLQATVAYDTTGAPFGLEIEVQQKEPGSSEWRALREIPYAGRLSEARGSVEMALPEDFAAAGSAVRFRARYQLYYADPDPLYSSTVRVTSEWVERPVVWVRATTDGAGAKAGERTAITATVRFGAADGLRQLSCIAQYSDLASGTETWEIAATDAVLRNGVDARSVTCNLTAPAAAAQATLYLANAPASFDFSRCAGRRVLSCADVTLAAMDLPLFGALSLDAARTGSASVAGATLARASGGPAAATATATGAAGNLSVTGASGLAGFAPINRIWTFSPSVVEASGFQADLSLRYAAADLPDDPGFDESRLTVVSYDPATGVARAWPTTVDRTARVATARVNGLAARYSLAAYGPFNRRFWNFPALSAGEGKGAALTFVNPSATPANLSLTGYARGTALNRPSASVGLAAGGQWTGLATDITPSAAREHAWMQAASDQPQVLALAWLAGGAGAAALPVPPLNAAVQILPEIEWKPGLATKIWIANPTPFVARASIELYDAQGAAAGSGSLLLAAKGGASVDAAGLFATAAPESFSGYAIVRGSQELAVAQVAASAFSVAALPGRSLAAAAPTRQYAAHAAVGEVTSRLTLVNTGTATARVTVRFVKDDGSAAAAPAILTLAAGQQTQRSLTAFFNLSSSEAAAGALTVESEGGAVTASLTQLAGEGLRTRTSTLLEGEPGRTWFLAQFTAAGGLGTSVALQNPSATAASAEVRVYAADGTRVGAGSLRVPTGGRASADVAGLVTQAAGIANGYIRIESDQPVTAVGWTGSASNPMLAAVAAQATYTPATPELPPAANTPALTLSSSALDFGAVTLGQAADRDLLLRNTGTVSLLVSSIETGGVFRVVSPAAPFSIAPGLSTGVTVRFTPTSTGAQSGVLTIVSNDPRNGRAAVTLSGTASGAAAAPLALSSSTLEFGNLAINTTRDAGVVIVNPTSGTVQLTTVLSNNPVFAVVNPTLPYSLAAGMNTPLIVRFAPTAVGPQSATLTIVTSAGQLTLAANGVATAGTAGARLLVSPLTLEFGNVPTSTSRDLTLSVTNPGTAPLEVTSAATGNTAFTVVSPAIPFLVTPGLVANMVVRFAPTTLGDQRGTLRIASSGGQAEVALSGAGAPLVVTPLFSDTFERESPSTCSLGAADNALGGNQEVYYFPLFRYPIADRIAPIGAEILRGAMRNPNFDYAGVQFSGAESNCMGSSASTFRQDFTIKMDVTLPPASDPDAVSQAGPFFRSRMHDLGAHIIGEQSAGFWLQLHSNGRLTLKRLATNETIASTGKPASFDGRRVHKLEVTVTGNTMQAALDSVLVQFDRGSTVTLPVETANQGGAGIAFSAEESRGAIGGQTVDNLVVTSPRPLP